MKHIENKAKKPPQRRSLETKDLIIETAAHFLRKETWERFTTNKVADLAGVSIGTLYKYFENKDQIIKNLMLKQFVKDLDALKEVFESGEVKDFEDGVRKVIRTAISLFNENPQLRVVIYEYMRKLKVADEKFSMNARMLEILMLNFEKFSNDRYLKPSNLSLYILMHSVLGAITAACMERPELLKDPQFEEELFCLIMGYFELRTY